MLHNNSVDKYLFRTSAVHSVESPKMRESPFVFCEVRFDFPHSLLSCGLDVAGQSYGTASIYIGLTCVCFVPTDFLYLKGEGGGSIINVRNIVSMIHP